MDIERLRREVLQKQKVLARIYADFGHLSLAEYASRWKVLEPPAGTLGEEFIGSLAGVAGSCFDSAAAAALVEQFARRPLVSTIDHHGIFGHPFFLSSNLIYGSFPGQRALVCLSTAGISLNNSSRPGSLLVSGTDGLLHRFSFFPDKQKIQTVLSTAAFTRQSAERVLVQVGVCDFLPASQKIHLANLIREVFFDPEILSKGDFFSQASLASKKLWQTVFPDAPELLYLPLEKLIGGLISTAIARDSRHILHRLFFTAPGWDSIEGAFLGSLGAFSHAHKGSFLFWGINPKGRRLHLAREECRLVAHGFTMPADVTAIAAGLQAGRIYPTSLACFLVLLYYEATCLGGFNQVNWLTDIKERFVGLLEALGESQTAERVSPVAADNFAEGDLAFGINGRGQIYKPAILDLYLKGDVDSFKVYQSLAGDITLKESIDSQLPEIYKIITPSAQRQVGLSAITPQDIWQSGKLEQKVRSLLHP